MSAATAVSASMLIGCVEEGRFSLSLVWDSSPPAPNSIDIQGRVEERPDPSQPGRVLAGTDPVPYTPNTRIALDGVPQGDNRVVIIEGRPRGVPGASVRYYGISQPFSLRAGETTQVEVLIGLREVPTGSRNRAAIAVDGAREVAGRIPQIDSAVVDLIFRATTASRVRLSSSSGFEDPVERPLGDPESCDAGECIYRIEGWDLDADQSTSCVGLDYCPRAVFAQLLDDFGYESEVLSTEVNVDTRPPSVDPDSFSVEYLPPNDNVLGRSVQAITEGTTVRVRFSTSEPVSTPSVDASDVQFTLTSSIGLSFVFDGVIGQPDPSTGERAVVIGMTDGAGNTAEQTRTAAFQLDVDAPGAATVDTSGAIVFRRAPWGDATSATPRFSLTGAAGAVEPGAVVRVFRGEGDLLTLIGEIPADATGAFDADLDTSDAPTVIIEVVDPAGNRGPQVAVRDGVWVASLAGKVLTDPFSNPHLVSRTPEIVPTRDQDEAPVDQSDLDALQARDSTRLRVDAVPVWRPNASGQTPPTRFGGRQGLTTDWARGVVMLSHGETNDIQSSPAKDTWQLDRWGWRSYDQASNPTPASSADIAYDALRERVFMHLPDGNGDWEFDGDAWTEVTPATRSQPTGECRMDFDERLGLVICGRLNEVWSWNGERWSSITTPAAMDSIVDVVYHAALERTLVVEIETNQMRVWSWDGVAWSQPTPPPANSYRDGRAAYDRKRDRLVIYGQLSSGQAVFEWDGTSWTTTTVNGLGGVLSGFTAITYHPGRERVVWLADTQLREWDGAEWLGWTAPVSSNAPTNVVRDPISGLDLTILEEPGNTLALYDVSGVVQRRRATTAIQSLSLDANGQSVIGRSNSLTYRYNGTGFVLVSVGGPGTAGLMTRARDRSQVVFVNASGTSTWNGTSWTAAGAGLDAERVFTDPATGRAIAYDTFSQPYAWTSSGWSPLQKPPIGDGFGAAFFADGARNSVWTFGGAVEVPNSPIPGTDNLARLSGSAWDSVVRPDGALWPPERYLTNIVSYPSGDVAMFGGSFGIGVNDGFSRWTLGRAEGTRPGLSFVWSWGAAGIPTSAIVEYTARAWASGAVDPDDGAATVGLELWRPRTSRWERMETGRAANDTVTLALSGGGTGERSPVGTRDLLFRTRLVSDTPLNAEQPSNVAVDFAELEVRYRLP